MRLIVTTLHWSVAAGALLALSGQTAFAWGIGNMVEHAAAYAAGGVAAHEAERYLDHRRTQPDKSGAADSSYQMVSASNAGGVDADGRYAVVFPSTAALPNRNLTPGAISPDVTQANLHETICRPGGYTRSIRPPGHYTHQLKVDGIKQYGFDDHRLPDYEEDHLISLELGGSPDSPQNLWPEPHRVIGGWGSYAKDKLENKLHALVCRGEITLARAQYDISNDWIAAYKLYVGSTPVQTRSHRYGG